MKRGRTLYALEVETIKGTEIDNGLYFTEVAAKKRLREIMAARADVTGGTVYELRVGKGEEFGAEKKAETSNTESGSF